MKKPVLWLLISQLSRPDIAFAAPALAWIADRAGAEFECYFESHREGRLFARTGSTVLGGRHFQQFNYLNATREVKYILYGDSSLFHSSIEAFQAEILAETDDLHELYGLLLKAAGISEPPEVLLGPDSPVESVTGKGLEILPYLYPEIYFHRRLAYPVSKRPGCTSGVTAFLTPETQASLPCGFTPVEELSPEDTYGSVTLRIARRNLSYARGVAFADPPAIASQLATLCRQKRVAVYGEAQHPKTRDIVFNDYTEAVSEINRETAELCAELKNPVLLGRQTGDGDLFAWGKRGVCMQIMDPNRPAFPIVEAVPHRWAVSTRSGFDLEPDDAQLERYADEGKILAGLVFHSGEMAHNEAMLNLVEYCSITGLKLGINVHAARYRTCPQLWELIQAPAERGGALGLVEPVLHSGGRGVMAEYGCPPALLKEHCEKALEEIRSIAGEQNLPRGYYAFADTDLETLSQTEPQTFAAVEKAGLEYFISSAKPGRNLILYQGKRMTVLNQTVRSQCYGSPFVRVGTVESFQENCAHIAPGWILATMDAPVVSFMPYIWQKGNRFTEIADFYLHNDRIVNATPHTISRYARILRRRGILPAGER